MADEHDHDHGPEAFGLPGDPHDFDPRQWAMHGLLRAYFDHNQQLADRRIEAIFDRTTRAAADPSGDAGADHLGTDADIMPPLRETAPPAVIRPPRSARAGLRRYCLTGVASALAACVGWLLIYVPGGLTPIARADEFERLPGFDCVLPGLPLLDDPAALAAEAAAIEAARAELRRRMALPDWSRVGDQSFSASVAAHWVERICRPLRRMGRWDEALSEFHSALDFTAGRNPWSSQIPDWHFVILADLGDTYLMLGDNAAGREAYLRSIGERTAYVAKALDTERQEHRRAHHAHAAVQTVSPLYWRMSYAALVDGDLDAARRWHAQEADLLRTWLTGVCDAAGTRPAGPTLLDAYLAMPEAFRDPPRFPLQSEQVSTAERYNGYWPSATCATLLRGHLIREARLCRVEGNFAAARQALGDAARVAFDVYHDESHTDFFEHIEAARVALGLNDPAAALAHADEAERCAAAVSLTDPLGVNRSHAPVGPAPRMELLLIRAAALHAAARDGAHPAAGQDEPGRAGAGADDARAESLVAAAQAIADRLAAPLSGPPRERFDRRIRLLFDSVNNPPAPRTPTRPGVAIGSEGAK